jgi:hypothetical protein
VRKLLLALTLLAALTSLAGPAAAAGTDVTLQSRAAWNTSHVNVGFTATCTGGTGSVTVQLRQGNTVGIGTTPNVVCDGQPHTGALTVPGVFQLGTAQATAALSSPGGSDSDTRTVQLVI